MASVPDSRRVPGPEAADSETPALRDTDGLWDWNVRTNRIHFSPRWFLMLGCDPEAAGNSPEEWFRRVHPDDADRMQADIATLLSGAANRIDTQHRLRHRDETYRWMACRAAIAEADDAGVVRITGSHVDITSGKVVDALTGLPNHVLMTDRLSRCISRARRHSGFLYAVLLLDIDRFTSHLERLGPAGADQLLIAAARRLERSLRETDTVARLAQDHVIARMDGDEFVVLLEELREIGDAQFVAERLLKELAEAFAVSGLEVFVTASVGIALSTTGYVDASEIMRDADIALHRAKSLGRARCEVFDTAGLDADRAARSLEVDLQQSMERQEFTVAYEPIVSAAGGCLSGFEALLRWTHPTRGAVAPAEFIPVAERTGLIVPLGRWVLREACRQLKEWQDATEIAKDLFVSVNLSASQFKRPTLLDDVAEALSASGLEPRCLLLELTESAVMENPQAATSMLMKLRVLGVKIGIDDFGTGYSSLSYLRQFPVDVLKVDRSFVGRSEGSRDLLEIVRSIRSLAHQLGLKVVAEGIENAEQLQLIRGLECEYGQGYFFSKPLDSQQAGELLRSGLTADLPATPATQASSSQDFAPAEEEGSALQGPSLPQAPARRMRLALPVVAASIIVFLAGGYLLLPGAAAPKPTPGTQADAGPSTSPAASAADDATPPAGAAPRRATAVYRFAVVHRHLLGGCKGTLTVAPTAVSFVPADGEDGFKLSYAQFTLEDSDDSVVMKTASKTYRFQAVTADSKADKRSGVLRIFRRLASYRSDATASQR